MAFWFHCFTENNIDKEPDNSFIGQHYLLKTQEFLLF